MFKSRKKSSGRFASTPVILEKPKLDKIFDSSTLQTDLDFSRIPGLVLFQYRPGNYYGRIQERRNSRWKSRG